MHAAATLLLLFLVASPPPVACDGVRRRSFVDEIPADVVKAMGDQTTRIRHQAFGIIVHMEETTSSTGAPMVEPVRKCEGVLLSPKVVLTGIGCRPHKRDTVMYFKFLGESIGFGVADMRRVRNVNLIELSSKPRNEPSVYPFLSWYTGSESLDDRYGIRPEFLDKHNVYLSSSLAYESAVYLKEKPTIDSALKNCKFVLKDELIALACNKLSVCQGSTVLTGSAFFTFTQTSKTQIVSIAGLVSLRSSGSFCERMNEPDDRDPYVGKAPKTPKCDDPYVCGRRFVEDDVKAILSEARKLDPRGLQLHNDYIPHDTISTPSQVFCL